MDRGPQIVVWRFGAWARHSHIEGLRMSKGSMPMTMTAPTRVSVGGQEYRYFAGYDYLGFAHDPGLIEVAIASLRRYGMGVSASRITTGERKIFEDLERLIAEFLRTDDAILLPSGSLSNIALWQSLKDDISVWFSDAQAHPSFMDIAGAMPGRLRTFRHLDATDLALAARQVSLGTRFGIFTDGLFALTGDIAPLPSILDLAGNSSSSSSCGRR